MALLAWASIYYGHVFRQIEARDFRPIRRGIFVLTFLVLVAGLSGVSGCSSADCAAARFQNEYRQKNRKLTVVKAAGRGMASFISCIFCRGLVGTRKDQLDNVHATTRRLNDVSRLPQTASLVYDGVELRAPADALR